MEIIDIKGIMKIKDIEKQRRRGKKEVKKRGNRGKQKRGKRE